MHWHSLWILVFSKLVKSTVYVFNSLCLLIYIDFSFLSIFLYSTLLNTHLELYENQVNGSLWLNNVYFTVLLCCANQARWKNVTWLQQRWFLLFKDNTEKLQLTATQCYQSELFQMYLLWMILNSPVIKVSSTWWLWSHYRAISRINLYSK